MGNFIGEYKNAISDDIVDALKDLMDSGKEFHTYGEIGTGQIDRSIKDSNDLNALDQYERDSHEIFDIKVTGRFTTRLEYINCYQKKY